MIIGIVGNKNVGKDTLADYLVEKKEFIKYAFADPLKSCLKELFGLTDEQLYGDKKEVIDPVWNTTPRELLQFFGTEVMQYKIQDILPNLKRTFFTKRFEQFIEANANKNIVVSDIRFQHELDIVLKYNGIIIKVERKNSSKTFLNHASEENINNLTNVTFIIDNDDTKESLFLKLEKIVE
jgi:GTPase SAR1 family protein